MAERDDADEILGKADALLARHRARVAAKRPEPPVDFPVLTDVFSQPFPPRPGASAPAAPAVAGLSDEQLAAIERELRLQLLELMGPELERLVEARVHARIAPVIAAVLEHTRTALENEIRHAVEEALTQVIQQEVARLQREGSS